MKALAFILTLLMVLPLGLCGCNRTGNGEATAPAGTESGTDEITETIEATDTSEEVGTETEANTTGTPATTAETTAETETETCAESTDALTHMPEDFTNICTWRPNALISPEKADKMRELTYEGIKFYQSGKYEVTVALDNPHVAFKVPFSESEDEFKALTVDAFGGTVWTLSCYLGEWYPYISDTIGIQDVEKFMVVKTEDYGKTFSKAVIENEFKDSGARLSNAWLDFVSETHGFIIVDIYRKAALAGANLSFFRLYETIDGGQSWNVICEVHYSIDWMDSVFSAKFISDTVGFVSFSNSYRTMFTFDGGKTWLTWYDYDGEDKYGYYEGYDWYDWYTYDMSEETGSIFTVTIYNPSDDSSLAYDRQIWQTSDNGQTWKWIGGYKDSGLLSEFFNLLKSRPVRDYKVYIS